MNSHPVDPGAMILMSETESEQTYFTAPEKFPFYRNASPNSQSGVFTAQCK